MSARIAGFIRHNVVGLIAIFIALGGTAYASNEWTGDNIVDGSLTSADYKNNDVASVDVANNSLKANDLNDNAIPSDDNCSFPTICFSSTKIADRAVGESEISPGAVGTSEVAPNSLTGSDIDESKLDASALPGPPGFYAFDDDTGEICNVGCTELTLRGIPAGSYLIVAKIRVIQAFDADQTAVHCELVAGANMATADTDLATFALNDDDAPVATLPMEVVHTFSATDNASINCQDGDFGDVEGANAKIAAIRLGSVNAG